MATENIMMDAVKAGGDRQLLHERIRVLSIEAGRRIKEEGEDNDLLSLIAGDSSFGLSMEKLQEQLMPEKFIGRSSQQVTEFIETFIWPVLEIYREDLGQESDIEV